jgi:proteasome lid subunit RPN8/RPN11
MLKITKEVFRAIITQARREAPLEACGYLAEQEGIVIKHFPLTNADASEEHYSLKPEEQFAAVRQMRSAGLKMRAVYHSHPNSPARPSEEDVKLAYDAEISYVIVSLRGGKETVKSFSIQGPRVTPEDIEIL